MVNLSSGRLLLVGVYYFVYVCLSRLTFFLDVSLFASCGKGLHFDLGKIKWRRYRTFVVNMYSVLYCHKNAT